MHTQTLPFGRGIQANASRVILNGLPVFEVRAAGFVRASLPTTWTVLTDYERLPEFVPDLVSARILARHGDQVTIEQQNRAGFLFVSQLVRMVVQVEEQPMTSMHVAMVSGDMRHYTAHWELEPASLNEKQGTQVDFIATLEPNFYLPSFIGIPAMQANVKQMVEAVVREIERRGAH